MLVEKYNFNTDESKMIPCNFNRLMKKITNRRFEYEGKSYLLEGFKTYRGYKLNRTDNASGAGKQDMNLDINLRTREIWTEINSNEMLYKLDKDEFNEFLTVLNSSVV